MNLPLILDVLARRRALRVREGWPRERLLAYQARQLERLRAFTIAHSAFYRERLRGLERAPLAALPVLTKREMMSSFDDLVTDPLVRLASVRRHLDSLTGAERYLGRYRVTRTAGTTGEPGVFVTAPAEWASIVTSYERAQRWAGVRAGLLHRTRLAVVSSLTPWHQSTQVGLSVNSPFVPVRRFDATQPLGEVVAGLNAWRPDNLIAYASMARMLADEAIAGRLRISPRAVMCASEPLVDEARARITQAWGVAPFNVYAATETAGIASECVRHRLHLHDDLVLAEVVDERNRPVPPGSFGAKVLVTALWSRTQPLIRYEVSDSVALSPEACDCGLPFAVVASVQGRAEEFVYLPGRDGKEVLIHPNVFHELLEALPLSGWQVVQGPGVLTVTLAGATADLDPDALRTSLGAALTHRGAVVPKIRVERVGTIARTRLGKAPLISALPRAPRGGTDHTPDKPR